jgi:hypothetical protein
MYSSNNIDYDNTFDLDEIRRAIQALFGPDDIVEFRVLKAKRDGKRYGTVSGYFDGKHRDVLAKTAEHWSGHVPGVYVTLNPVLPDLLARSKNQVTNWAEHTTKDAEVSRRVWLLIDFDAKRPPGISASDAEHEAALDRARECKQWLSEKGWPRPIYADSGNGGHLLYRIDLPNDPEVTQLVKGCLDTIAVKWSDETVDVDRSVYNSARIIKLYGTLAAKGDETPDRPHRISKMLEVPDRVEAVPR